MDDVTGTGPQPADARTPLPPAAALWTPEDVAAFLQVSKRLVDHWREEPDFPEPLALPSRRLVRFWGEDIVAWARGVFDRRDPERTRSGVIADAA